MKQQIFINIGHVLALVTFSGVDGVGRQCHISPKVKQVRNIEATKDEHPTRGWVPNLHANRRAETHVNVASDTVSTIQPASLG